MHTFLLYDKKNKTYYAEASAMCLTPIEVSGNITVQNSVYPVTYKYNV